MGDWLRCDRCGKPVRLKAWLGTWHLCATDCEVAGRHLGVVERRRGPLWRRRTEYDCERCHSTDIARGRR